MYKFPLSECRRGRCVSVFSEDCGVMLAWHGCSHDKTTQKSFLGERRLMLYVSWVWSTSVMFSFFTRRFANGRCFVTSWLEQFCAFLNFSECGELARNVTLLLTKLTYGIVYTVHRLSCSFGVCILVLLKRVGSWAWVSFRVIEVWKKIPQYTMY